MTTPIVRFGKNFGPLMDIKKDSFARNDELLSEQKRISEVYCAQPKRLFCKICTAPLNNTAFFLHEVGYAWCPRCGHLNGLHEDTKEFSDFVYSREGGKDYARMYGADSRAAYDKRVQGIYKPKAEFLFDGLTAAGERPASLQFVDFGAGSGYFVAALKSMGLNKITGWEPALAQIALSDEMLGPGCVRHHKPEAAVDVISTLDADVLSMIGVLEHLMNPREVLAACSANSRLRWLYLSLPLAGPAVAIEALFPTVARRHLVGGHTHLFTESSINWICDEFSLHRVAEWWFGSDILDLYRSGLACLSQKPETAGLCDLWRSHMLPVLDALQLQLDQRKLSTEVHLLLAKS